jgi:pyruvate dehydrogenase E2 component (dihydrolipoamide acetyltransferase)
MPPARTLATPLARAVATDLGVDLTTVTGTGRGGRIKRSDVEAAARAAAGTAAGTAAGAAAGTAPGPGGQVIGGVGSGAPGVGPGPVGPGVGLVPDAPHFHLTITVDAEALLGFRERLNRQVADLEVSVNDLVVKACAGLLAVERDLNVSWGGDRILRHRRVHVGVAVTPGGRPVVPVVRDADRKTLRRVAREVQELTGRARAGEPAPSDLGGATFTVSDLGGFGTEQVKALINPPEAAVLAVGAVQAEPVATDDGQVAVHRRMRLTLSIDHRALDGATGARFLARLKETLEHPLQIVA